MGLGTGGYLFLLSPFLGTIGCESAASEEEQEASPAKPLAAWGEEEGRSWRPGYQAVTNSASKHATSSNARSFLCFGKTRTARSLSLTRSCLASGGAQPALTHKQDSPGQRQTSRYPDHNPCLLFLFHHFLSWRATVGP